MYLLFFRNGGDVTTQGCPFSRHIHTWLPHVSHAVAWSPSVSSRSSPAVCLSSGRHKCFWIADVFYPSWLGCYHTQCLFFFIKRCKLCDSKCWKLRIFHLFVERQTGWHNFNQTTKRSLACPERKRKIMTPCALLSEKPGSSVHSVNALVPGQCPGGHVMVSGTLSEMVVPLSGDRRGKRARALPHRFTLGNQACVLLFLKWKGHPPPITKVINNY